MKTSLQNQSSEHNQVALLLPWYVNKTLNRDEFHLVEQHLKSCLICKIELTNQQKLSVSISQEDLLAPVAHASFLQLKNRIHNNKTSSKKKSEVHEKLISLRLWFFNLSTKRLISPHYPSIVLGSLLLLTFSLIFPAFDAKKQNIANTFQTLSSSKNTAYKHNEIRLIFSNEITQNEILKILQSVQGQIIAGPTAQGVYRVRLGKEEINPENLIKTLSILRDKKQVIFSEPAFTLSSTSKQNPG